MNADLTPTPEPGIPQPRDVASSTSLKWGQNGELSPVDLQRVLERLTDPSLTQCSLHSEGSAD
jgi:hypothetical protein